MDEQLLMLVSDRLDSDTSLDDDAGLLVLAACEGDHPLIGAISGEWEPRRPAAKPSKRGAKELPGAYLRSISVEGFRGVGAQCGAPSRTVFFDLLLTSTSRFNARNRLLRNSDKQLSPILEPRRAVV